jgi:hypothetical protein
MVAFTLESLVLRGVAVLRDGTVSLRRGAGVTYCQAPEVRLAMRHPSPGWVQGFAKPDQRPDHADQNRVDKAANGAGRSRSRAAVFSRTPARIAGLVAGLCRWLGLSGGPKSAAAMCLCLAQARPVAPVNEPDGGKPSGRTPPASTWGQGLR